MPGCRHSAASRIDVLVDRPPSTAESVARAAAGLGTGRFVWRAAGSAAPGGVAGPAVVAAGLPAALAATAHGLVQRRIDLGCVGGCLGYRRMVVASALACATGVAFRALAGAAAQADVHLARAARRSGRRGRRAGAGHRIRTRALVAAREPRRERPE